MERTQLGLYLVTDSGLSPGCPLETIVARAVAGGVTMVQLREKHASSRAFYELAMALKKCLSAPKVPLIINDRLDIALACDADGLHIGQQDIPYEAARRLLGKDKIIGLSVENIEDARNADKTDVDYIGISPVFGTPTKTDTAPPLGLEGIRQISRICRHPSVGIGGINEQNAAGVLTAGAAGIAVVSAIMSAPDPEKAARTLKELVIQAKRN